jgi:hypothetical protein
MSKLGIFNQATAPLNLDAFKPRTDEQTGPAPEEIDRLTAGTKFRSREPRPVDSQPTVSQPETVSQRSIKRPPLTYRTGRNVTVSVKTTQETVDAFYNLARSLGWKAGETFEQAIQALQEKLARGGKGG